MVSHEANFTRGSFLWRQRLARLTWVPASGVSSNGRRSRHARAGPSPERRTFCGTNIDSMYSSQKKYAPQAADCVALRFTKRYRKLFKLTSCLILVMGSKALALGCMELAKAATD